MSALFIINRYMTSLGYIPIAYFVFNPPLDLAVSGCNLLMPFTFRWLNLFQMYVIRYELGDPRSHNSIEYSRCQNYIRFPAFLSLTTQVIISCAYNSGYSRRLSL